MKCFIAFAVVCLVAGCCAVCPRAKAPAAAPAPAYVQDSLIAANGCKIEREGDVARLTIGHSDRGVALTPAQYRPPFVVKLRAKTDSTNIRLYWNLGMVILNWEVSPDALRIHDPATNVITSVDGKGLVTPGEWHDIVWEVRPGGSRLAVDDEVRFDGEGDYSGLTAPVGVGPAWGSTIWVERMSVEPL